MCHPGESTVQLGRAMRAARKHLGRSQLAVARRMGRTRECLSHFERGKLLPPRPTWTQWLEAIRHDAANGLDAPSIAEFEALIAAAVACYRRAAAEARAAREGPGGAAPASSTQSHDPVRKHEESLFVTVRGESAASDPSPAEEGATNRRRALAAAGTVTAAMLLDAVEESQRLSHAGEQSDLGPVTLEHLDLAVQRFGEEYLRTPLDRMFGEVRRTRHQVLALLEHRRTLSQERHLYVVLGWLSGLLGSLSFDMGDAAAGRAHGITALQLAKEAGHNAITAWVRGNQAMIETYAGQGAEAVRFAQAGQQSARRGSGVVVRLAALESRAAGLLGDRITAEDAIRRAKDAVQALQVPPSGGILSGATHDPHYYGSTAYIRLGLPRRAQEEARAALAICAANPSAWPSDRAVSHLDLAMAAVMLDDPGEACREGGEALDIYVNERQTGVLLLRARELNRSLARFGADPAVRDFGERLRSLAA